MNNVSSHYVNFGANSMRRKFWEVEDALGLERNFDSWYKKQVCPMLTVRYETMWDHLKDIEKYANISFRGFPVYRPRKANYEANLSKYPESFYNLYRSLNNKIKNAEDIKLWT